MRRLIRAKPIRLLLIAHVIALTFFFVWIGVARAKGLPFATIARDPVSAVEAALHEVQQHPDEGIYALARLHLPPYTGILHTGATLAWMGAVLLGLRARLSTAERVALLLFPVLLLQDSLFLTAERAGAESLVDECYLAALALALGVATWRHRTLDLVLPGVATAWLLLRVFADDWMVSPAWADHAETFADLQIPLLWAAYFWAIDAPAADSGASA